MLKIYPVSIQWCRDIQTIAKQVQRFDRNLADQMRRAVASVPLNLAESDGVHAGNRVLRRRTALGSAREVSACCDVAEALDYVRVDAAVRGRANHVIGTLVNLTR